MFYKLIDGEKAFVTWKKASIIKNTFQIDEVLIFLNAENIINEDIYGSLLS